jgi:hypothetical protein
MRLDAQEMNGPVMILAKGFGHRQEKKRPCLQPDPTRFILEDCLADDRRGVLF